MTSGTLADTAASPATAATSAEKTRGGTAPAASCQAC